jgi:hypothetical protein
MVWTLGIQTHHFNFLETRYNSQTGFTAIQYSASNNGLQATVDFRGNVVKIKHIEGSIYSVFASISYVYKELFIK